MDTLAGKWTADRIAKLSDADLTQLSKNAQAKYAERELKLADERVLLEIQNLIDVCDLEMQRRNLGMSAMVRDAQRDADQKLVAFANDLKGRFDLSKETAIADAKADQISNFHAHELLGVQGGSKVGGWQLRGLLQLDRYISYRSKNDVFRLACLLHNGDPASSARWYVLGPKGLIGEWLPLGQHDPRFVKALQEVDGNPANSIGGWRFANFAEAREKFEELIAGVASARTLVA